MLPSEIVVVGKTQFSFLQPYQKKAEEKRQQWGEREGVKEKNEARSKLCFLFSFDFFLLFFFWFGMFFLVFLFALLVSFF